MSGDDLQIAIIICQEASRGQMTLESARQRLHGTRVLIGGRYVSCDSPMAWYIGCEARERAANDLMDIVDSNARYRSSCALAVRLLQECNEEEGDE